jgi:molybdopterin-synthase adenylyltransferase
MQTQTLSDDRYARHRLIPGFSQELVAKLRIGVVGAGAIGNEVIKNLLLMGVGSVDVYDFDTAEISNLTRSVFLRETDVGLNKAQALINCANELHADTQMRAFAGPIDRTLSLQQFAHYDLVIAAVDNMAARLRINDMALLTETPWINTAIDSRNAVVELFPRKLSKSIEQAACYVCNLPESVFEREAQRYSCGGLQRAAYITRTVPTTTITASAVGALAVSELLRYIHACNPSKSSELLGKYNIYIAQRVFFDTAAPAISRTLLPRASDERGCSGCGIHSKLGLVSAHTVPAEKLVKQIQELPDQPVRLSDAVIVDCHCTRCNANAQATPLLKALLGTRVQAHTDAILHCEHCLDPTVNIDAREILSSDDFKKYFDNQAPDCAWIIQGEQCFDLLPTNL